MLPIDFSDRPGWPVSVPDGNIPITEQMLRDRFAVEVGPFFAAASYGKTNLEVSVASRVYRVAETASLYVEALVGTHPLLEDFKLLHRALDVKKVQAEVRHAELENVRLTARVLKGKDEDPDIEKKIVVEANGANVTVSPDTE